MSTEEYDEKLIIIKKFNYYLESILLKSYNNDFEELETLANFVNIYLNKEKIDQETEEFCDTKEETHVDNEEQHNDTESEDELSNGFRFLI